MNQPQRDMLQIAEKYAALSLDKRLILKTRLQQNGIGLAHLRMSPFRVRADRFPLSHGQERLWFLWRLEPQSGMNNVSGAVRLEGDIDEAALRASLRGVVERHESLRMRVEEVDGVGWQVIASEPAFDFATWDLSIAPEPEREPRLAQRLREFAAEPFDLTRGPLLRANLFRLDARTHVLALAMHHIVSDGWSISVLLQELSAFYAAACENRVAKLPSLPMQYGDYALWQREWLDDASLGAQLDYWRNRLGSEQPALRLPVDRERRGPRGTAGGRLVRDLPVDLAEALGRLSLARRVTLFTTLLAAFDVLLARYGDQRDIRIGVPMAGRQRAETAGLIGFFVNTVVIRGELDGAMPFGALLAQVRERVLEAQANQDVPFTRLVETLQPERDLSRTPLFQVMFNFEQGGGGASMDLPGLKVSGIPAEVVAAQFDLTLNVQAKPGALQLAFDYAHDIFDVATIERIATHYVEILRAVCRDGDVRLGEIVFGVPDANAPVAYPFRPVVERIAAQAAARPDAEAIGCEGARLRYGELARWSNRIARRLRRLGVTADERVGLCVERSPGLVAGLLGVLTAGAAFVPLDPAYPAARLADMLEDAGVRRVVTDRASAGQLSEVLAGCELVLVSEVDDESSDPLDTLIHPDQLAYVIYTSGSTGRPKGVAVSHRALSLHVDDFVGTYRINAADSVLHSSTINFDVALHELLPALAMGGRVVMRGPQMWDLDRLTQALIDDAVTFSRIPTAYWQQWLQRLPEASALPHLRQVTVGGEALPGDALKRWQAGPLSHIALDNLYGPTETTIAALYRETGADDADEVIVPIGRTYPGRSAAVRDADGNVVPAGGFGELCIGGASLARGYLGRPGLTAERFVPDPDGGPGGRLYRSGDLCRQRDDGTTEFLGRLDQQIKLRGFRIELGEIETALRRGAGVSDAVAAVMGEGEGRRLIGYVVGDVDVTDLREVLARQLPEHMVPSEIVTLASLPLMPNGKVDRAALPEPEARIATAPVAPRNAAEEALLAVWCGVLKRDDIGVMDNFFALGGDSILSLQVIARAREAGLKLTPKQIFAHPTVAGAAAIAQLIGSETDSDQVAVADFGLAGLTQAELERLGLRLDTVQDIYPATPLQQGLIFHGLLSPGQGVYLNQLRFTLAGALDRAALRGAWEAAFARHEVLRTSFEWRHGGEALQVVHRQAQLAYTEHDWSTRGADDYAAGLSEWRAGDLAGDFDLATAPLMRVNLFARPDGGHDLVWTLHHALMDGWSASQLLNEISADYRARRAGAAVALPAQRPYRDYVAWLRQQPSAEAWWRSRLSSEAVGLTASLGRPRRIEPGTHRLRQPLDTGLAERLRQAAQRREVTLNTLMQGAWAIVLARFGGRRQVVFGTTVSGRPAELSGVERMLGLFINSLPVWVEVAGDSLATPWLRQLQDLASEMRQYEHTPLSQLQQWAGKSGDALFDSLIVFENYPVEPALAGAGGLQVTGSDALDRTHYPLALAVLPRNGLVLEWEWDGERVDRDSIARLSACYLDVLAALSRDGDIQLGEIELGVPVANAPVTYPFRPVVDRIAAQAAVKPDAEAIGCEGARLRYGELAAWANRIARRLRRLGVTADERVGLCVERSPGLVAGLLGVLNAGAAFVPLDPAYPAARLADMLEDAGVRRVVTDRASAGQLSEVLSGCELVIVSEVDDESSDALHIVIHPDQLAYIIYTSGSTGRPKGVAVSHRALSLHVDDFVGTYRITAADSVLHSSTINFDVALHELLPALSMGGRVVMRGPQMWDLDRLTQALIDEAVTFSRIPTAYWQQWLQRLPAASALPHLRQVTVGGEALPGDALRRWQAGPLSHIALDNLYGPTETTIAALYRQTSADDADEVIVPIGRTYPGRSAAVRDADGNVVPAGGFGELCIGGASLARGYLGRPGLTAERFVPDPDGAPGGRLYRSGDLCRQRDDGTVEFLGRLDQQIKLRGFRIELGEIETALRRGAGVTDAVAAVMGEGESRRLIGYVVGDVDITDLREALARQLPEHMVPSEIVSLASLPLMPNGKVDRAALPEPEARLSTAPVAPRNAAEDALLAVWHGVLKRDEIGVMDNFFALGGDSILSLQVIARAREAGLRLTPKQMFAHPTVAGAAAVAQVVAGTGAEAAITGTLPLTPIQARFFARHPDGPAHWNQAVLLRVTGALDAVVLETALQALVARHDALRLRFWQTDGIWQQRVATQNTHRLLEVIDLGDAADWPQRLAAEGTRLQQSLELGAGPLLRAGYFRVSGGEGRLLIAIHHLAVDGVSWRILLPELQQALGQAERGEPIALPPGGTPWSVWVTKLAAYAQGPVVTAELDWWRAALAPASGATLPIDGEGDRALGASRVLTFRLDQSATQRLRQDGLRAYGLRPDELLLTALAQTLAAWSGHAGALIDLEGHGREDVIDEVDLSRTVGWFTTRYPVWLDAPTDAGAALVAVKEQLRAVPHKGLHFGLLSHSRDDAATAAIRALPKAGVSFNYLGQFDRSIDGDGRFGLAQESGGISASDASPMAHLLDLNGRIVDGALSLTWRYSPGVLADATVRGLVDDFAARVDALITHCGATERLANRQSVSALAAHLKVSARDLPGNILPLNALGSGMNLFCLHPGYGLVSEFQPLATALDGTVTVYGVQSPIYSEPDWRAASFDAMAADYVDRICRIAPQGPICLLGWSLGGRLAVSMARHVAIRRRELAFVGLVDIGSELDRVDVTPAETVRLNAELPVLFASLRDVFRSEVSQIISGRVAGQANSRTALSPGTTIANDEERLIETMVDVVAHHRRLLLDHQYPRIATMLHLWWAAHPARAPEQTEWRHYTSAGVEVVDTLDATHATIIRHPALAARIRDILSQRCAVRSGS